MRLSRQSNRRAVPHAEARNAVGAIALIADMDWPPRAVTMRVFDVDGREVHSALTGDSNS